MALTQFNIHSGFPFTFFVVIFILLSRFTPREQTDLTSKLIMLCAHLVARNDDNMYVWRVWKQVRVRFFPFIQNKLQNKYTLQRMCVHGCSFFCYSPPFLWLLTILALLYFFGIFCVVVVVFCSFLKWMHIILTLPSKCCEYTISKHQVTKQ